jgi:hypothetical protein
MAKVTANAQKIQSQIAPPTWRLPVPAKHETARGGSGNRIRWIRR